MSTYYLWRSVVEFLNEGLIAVDNKNHITYLNNCAAELLGARKEGVVGKNVEDFLAIPASLQSVPDTEVQSGSTQEMTAGDTLLRRADGSMRDVSYRLISPDPGHEGPEACVIILRDTTETRRHAEEVRKAQRIESLSRLARGIAHDLNNVLTAVLGNVSLAKSLVGADSELAEIMTDAEQAADDAKQLSRGLMLFSQGTNAPPVTGRLGAVVKESASFATRGSNVRCRFAIPESVWDVSAAVDEVAHVIRNLVMNAVEAMEHGGVVEVSVENVTLSSAGSAEREGSFVSVSVRDTGGGIPRAYLSKVFDPYFTTKDGSVGLGLTIAQSIVRNNSGFIDVDSRPGEGTALTVYFPARVEAECADKPAGSPGALAHKRILFMDDEPYIREVVGRMLTRLGCSPTFAQNGDEAVHLYRKAMETGHPFDVTILDLTVPGGMGGREAVARLQEMDQEVRALVSSGYPNDPVMEDPAAYGFKGIITKPYAFEDLSVVLYSLLGSPDS